MPIDLLTIKDLPEPTKWQVNVYSNIKSRDIIITHLETGKSASAIGYSSQAQAIDRAVRLLLEKGPSDAR